MISPSIEQRVGMVGHDDASGVVLLVEDEPLVRLFVADLLLEAGFRVIEAANAAEALTVLNAGLPVHVVFADVDMPPGPSGFELAQQVRQRWPEVEILVTSGRNWPAEGALPAGVAFLSKPSANDVIVASVRAAAARARSKRSAGGEDAPQANPVPRSA